MAYVEGAMDLIYDLLEEGLKPKEIERQILDGDLYEYVFVDERYWRTKVNTWPMCWDIYEAYHPGTIHLIGTMGYQWCVHHLNGNGSDDRIENLRLLSVSTHSRLHIAKYWQNITFEERVNREKNRQETLSKKTIEEQLERNRKISVKMTKHLEETKNFLETHYLTDEWFTIQDFVSATGYHIESARRILAKYEVKVKKVYRSGRAVNVYKVIKMGEET